MYYNKYLSRKIKRTLIDCNVDSVLKVIDKKKQLENF